jgi:hypothetical protein
MRGQRKERESVPDLRHDRLVGVGAVVIATHGICMSSECGKRQSQRGGT